MRKFFNADTPDSGAGTSIAALMARQGVRNESEQMVATPIVINTETKDEPAANEPTNVATTPVESPAATATPETPSPVVEPAKAEPTPPVAAVQPTPAPTWQEVLRQQQPDIVLKELLGDDKVVNFVKTLKEVDPKMVAFLEKWQNKEDLTSYLREMTTDYSKMSAEDVMRNQLRQEYPKASPQQLEILFNREVIKAYSLDSDDPTEVEEGRLLLEAKADRHRDSFVQKQSEYLLPNPPEPKQPEPDYEAEAAQKRVESYHNAIKSDPYTQAIVASKQISVGEGEEKYNHPVNPESLLEVLLDDTKWAQRLFTVEEKNGEKKYTPNVAKQLLIGAILTDDNFLKAYGEHYRSLGAKSVASPIENASMPDGSTPSAAQAAPKTPAEAMARAGRLT